MRRLIGWWVLSLALVAVAASAVTAQSNRAPQINRTPPRVLSGADVGFRVEGTDMSGKPVGTLVVRINGDWVEVGGGIKAVPATR